MLTATAPNAQRQPRRSLHPDAEVFAQTLEHLYIRRSALEDLIRSLEAYREMAEVERKIASGS